MQVNKNFVNSTFACIFSNLFERSHTQTFKMKIDPSMKKILFLLLSLFCTSTISAQNTYANAKALVDLYENSSLITDTVSSKAEAIAFFKILKRQYTFEENVTPRDILNDYRKDNNDYLLIEVEKMFALIDDKSSETVKYDEELTQIKVIRKEKMDSVLNIVRRQLFAEEAEKNNTGDLFSNLIGRVKQDKNKSSFERRLNILEYNRRTIDIDRRIWGKLDEKNKRTVLQLRKDLFKLDEEMEKYNDNTNTLRNDYDLGDDKSFSDRYISPGTAQPIDVSKTVIVQSSAASLQTSLIDATATFIAERMKEELNVAFFDRFEKFIADKNVKLLFPTTFNVLEASEASNYALMIKIVKDAFEEDLKNVVFNTPHFLSQTLEYSKEADSLKIIVDELYRDWYQQQNAVDSINVLVFNLEEQLHKLDSTYEALSDLPSLSQDTSALNALGLTIEGKQLKLENLQKQLNEFQLLLGLKENNLIEQKKFKTSVSKLFKYLTLSVEVLKKVKEGQHPAKLLAFLRYNLDELVPNSEDLKSSLTLLDIISQSLFSSTDSSKTVWIGIKELGELKSNPMLRRFYLGLVYQQIQLNLANDYNLIRAEELSIDKAISQAKQQGYRLVENSKRELSPIIDNLADYKNELVKDTLIINAVNYYYNAELQADSIFTARTDMALDSLESYSETIGGEIAMTLLEINHPDVPGFIDEASNSIFNEIETKLPEDVNAMNIEQYTQLFENSFQAAANSSINLSDSAANIKIRNGFKAIFVGQMLNYLKVTLEENEINIKAKDQAKHKALRILLTPAIRDSAKLVNAVKDRAKYRQIDLNIRFSEFTSHLQTINQITQNRKDFVGLINQFITVAVDIDNQLNALVQIQRNKSIRLSPEDLFGYYKSSLAMVNLAIRIAAPDSLKSASYRKFQDFNATILKINTAAMNKDFGNVMINTMSVLEDMVDWKFGNQQMALPYRNKLKAIFKYGAFMVALAEAKNNNEVKNAIKAIALPTGSYSIKRRNFFTIGLNAYPGGTAGYEYAFGPRVDNKFAPNLGFTAQLGIDFSWGNSSKIDLNRYNNRSLVHEKYRREIDRANKFGKNGSKDFAYYLKGSSKGIFVSLIDLGAVVLFRLDNETDPLPSDVNFQQLFSPGISYVYGFKNMPLTLMTGASLSPELRKFGEESANSLRFNLSMVVDIPLFNFYTRTEAK